MNLEAKEKEIQMVRHTLAESQLAMECLRKVITEMENRLKKLDAPRHREVRRQPEDIPA